MFCAVGGIVQGHLVKWACLLLALSTLELIHLALLKCGFHWLVTPYFPLTQTLATAILHFHSMNLTILDTSWSGIAQYLCLWSFISLSIMYSRFIYVLICNYFIYFYGWIVFHWANISYFVYPFNSWWTFELFLLFR